METIKLKISKKFYDKFLAIIEKCNPEDLQIVNDDYVHTKAYLESQLKELDSESAEFLTLEELDVLLENTLTKYAS